MKRLYTVCLKCAVESVLQCLFYSLKFSIDLIFQLFDLVFFSKFQNFLKHYFLMPQLIFKLRVRHSHIIDHHLYNNGLSIYYKVSR